MKNRFKYLITTTFILLLWSCSNNDDTEMMLDHPKNVSDCSLNYSADPNTYVVGICLDGTNSALPNETITFASKATPNFSEIIWTVASGDMTIINIENSIENNPEPGRLKSIATIRFNSGFSGGSLRAEAVNNEGEYAGMNHLIEPNP